MHTSKRVRRRHTRASSRKAATMFLTMIFSVALTFCAALSIYAKQKKPPAISNNAMKQSQTADSSAGNMRDLSTYLPQFKNHRPDVNFDTVERSFDVYR